MIKKTTTKTATNKIFALISLLRLVSYTQAFTIVPQRDYAVHASLDTRVSTLLSSRASNKEHGKSRPQLIVLDLDGNLWRPEMYELAWDGMGHAPFQPWGDGNDGTTKLKSQLGSVVTLIGDVADLLDEFVLDSAWQSSSTELAISSRTDVPVWAEELMQKFVLPKSGKTLEQVISGPWEIKSDSKIHHFERLAKKTGIPLKNMVFFDNERGNCQSIAKLGVTVGFCPNGVKRSIWSKTMDAYPNTDGTVIGLL